uniref:Uncharacterized protein n=1 Tax=Anguilla anguilla TaxID=7936 RepID=A0A0E9VCA5_ANGAN
MQAAWGKRSCPCLCCVLLPPVFSFQYHMYSNGRQLLDFSFNQ